MPANSAGRMYFYLGSPNSQYYDFIEFTVGSSSINVDTTRVDRFGLKLALLLHGHDGSNQEVGENYATFQENYYAQFWHQNAINGLQYGFPYDDDAGQSSDISITNPQYLVVAVGW